MLSIAPPAPKLSPRSVAAPSPSTRGGHGKPRLSGTGTGAHPATPRLSASKPTPAPTEPRPRRAPSATAPTTWKTTPPGHKPTSEQPRNGQTSGDTESAAPYATQTGAAKQFEPDICSTASKGRKRDPLLPRRPRNPLPRRLHGCHGVPSRRIC